MKVKVRYDAPGMEVDETFSGATAEEVVSAMKRRVAAEAGFAVRLMVGSMSPLGFVQEVVRRYNRQKGRSLPIPSTCEQFLKLAEAEGIARVLEE